MTRDKQIVAGVVVLAALGGAAYLQTKKDMAVGTQTTTSGDLPDIKGGDDIDKISITNGDKGEVVLEKKGDKWRLTKPVDALANQSNVKSMIDNLKELKVKEVVNSAPTPEVKKDLDLEPNKAVHIVAWKGTDKKLDQTYGKSAGRGQMMRVEGKPAIYAADKYSNYLYAREVKNWRDQEIWRFDDANAIQLTIDNTNGALSFTKNGDKWAGTFKGHPIERFDEEKVKDAVRAFKNLNADDFGDGKSLAETGLNNPEAKVSVTLKDNAGKYDLLVGKNQSGGARWAKRADNDQIIAISSWAADWATGEVKKFQKPVDGGAPSTVSTPPGMPGMPGMPPGMAMPGMGEDDDGHGH